MTPGVGPAVDDSGGDGVPLLLIGGLGANVGMWRPFRASLGHRRTVAYDAPGTGGTPTPERVLSVEELAAVAAGVVDRLGADRVDVLGYSFGGFVAQELARADGRVRSLVLAATTAGWSDSPCDVRELFGPGSWTTPLAVALLLTPTRYHLSPVGQRLVRLAFGDWRVGDYRTSDRERVRHPPSAAGYWLQVLASLDWSSRGWLHRVAVPALVLAGATDSLATPAAARYLGRQLRGRVEVLAGAGHSFLLHERPARAAALVSGFLDGLDQPSAAAPLAALSAR